ncbi:Nitroreductase family [Oligella ureolytica]|uniref:Nitroreductase family n=1 Tax=Oligella ureolytica TaxID=90244 RepID=A0A378XEN7_9BURK|nr:nitroreductase family protein [Oligella ureolytica]QPT40788.1 nitroreductase family protein [Oligella ureolytica]SUA52773.1 Nitroreductase family [Oligella ureolytica]SUA58068.1 Nitroreductase family [Oligella ureolytica]
MSFYELAKKRRSIYHLGKNIELSNDKLVKLIKDIVDQTPSSFHSQTSRVVILLGEEHDALWEITREKLRAIVGEENFEGTDQKINSFKAAKGTVLFYEDKDVVSGLQKQFPLYADNFPIWSEHSTGLTQYAVWLALAEVDIGASLQHYNPIIDADVATRWDIPSNWVLRAQMPFGSIESPASEKNYLDEETRYRVFSA